jgi:pimeloyl-ACP methyl ester carboxylesterase
VLDVGDSVAEGTGKPAVGVGPDGSRSARWRAHPRDGPGHLRYTMAMAAEIVLVHGGWGTPNDWDLVIHHLEGAGVRSRVVDLPSTRRADAGLDADIAEVQSLLDECDAPVLVGHSYSGMVVTPASAGRPLHHLVYVAAFVPDGDDTALSLLSSVPSPRSERSIKVNDDGTTTVEPWPLVDAVSRFGEAATAAMAKVPRRAQSIASGITAAPAFGWKEHDATYVLASKDEVVPPDLQRVMAAKLANVVEIDTNHFPMFEAPRALAEILISLAVT